MADEPSAGQQASSPWEGHEDVPDDVILVQLGNAKVKRSAKWDRREFSFRYSLREDEGEDYMSLLEGPISVSEAVPLVNRGDLAGTGDCTRSTTAAHLRDAGFVVVRWPTKPIPNHVAVFQPQGEWDDNAAVTFSRCFTDFSWKADVDE